MKHYFLSKGKLNEGPFKYEELLTKGITADTWVWYAGSKGWERASNVEELKSIVPPSTDVSVYEKKRFTATDIALEDTEEYSIGGLMIKGFTIIAVLVIIFRLLEVL
ncbi:MAG: hypothetical protein JWQ96_1242 [Segetibacter sp.]|nr:hypothetical protein [Segetibacter sp.]